MKHNPLVTVIMRNYNRAHCISRAIQSVVDQSYENWELLIIDNSSEDESLEIVESFGDNRIRVYNIQNEGIIAKSINLGIEKAKGLYVAILDTDDWWFREKLRLSIAAIESSNASASYHELRLLKEGQNRLFTHAWPQLVGTRRLSLDDQLADLLMNGNALANSSVVVKLDVIRSVGGFHETPELRGAEDYYTWLLMASEGYRLVDVGTILGGCSFGKDNMSSASLTITHTKYLIAKFLHEYPLLGRISRIWLYEFLKAKYRVRDFSDIQRYLDSPVVGYMSSTTNIKYCFLRFVFSMIARVQKLSNLEFHR